MHRLSLHKTGLVLGVVMVIVHVLWALAVVTGAGEWYLNLIFKLHMLSNPFVVTGFAWGSAIMLWIVVFVLGYILGAIFAWAWNWLHKPTA